MTKYWRCSYVYNAGLMQEAGLNGWVDVLERVRELKMMPHNILESSRNCVGPRAVKSWRRDLAAESSRDIAELVYHLSVYIGQYH